MSELITAKDLQNNLTDGEIDEILGGNSSTKFVDEIFDEKLKLRLNKPPKKGSFIFHINALGDLRKNCFLCLKVTKNKENNSVLISCREAKITLDGYEFLGKYLKVIEIDLDNFNNSYFGVKNIKDLYNLRKNYLKSVFKQKNEELSGELNV